MIVEYWKDKTENPTIQEVFTEWNDRRLELKKISPATHTRNKQIFNRHFRMFGERKIKSLSMEDFIEFLEEQIPEFDLTAKGYANLKGVTKGLLLRAKRRKLISFSPDEVFEEADVSETEFRKVVKEDCEEVFDEQETDLMVRYLIRHPDVWNLGILLMFMSGIRVGELVALKWDCFQPDVIYIRRTETRFRDGDGPYQYAIKEFPKTQAGWRAVVLPQAYQWIYDAFKNLNEGIDSEFIMVREDGSRLNTNCMRHRMYRVCKEVGILPRSPHKIRKTYCSILSDYKVSEKLIIDQMGHTSILISNQFYNRNRQKFDEKAKTISAIPEFQQKLALVK
ncbi:MAG: tyrosine-type recombinase/integrase [Lachnospiraceae bacterium]|nr:tyrosine-type recombinase/integrase [Lachnospiraceae bacterium]